MKIAYFDCFSGAGGDMIAAAFIDAGLDKEFLLGQLDSLGIEGLEVKIFETVRCGLRAIKFEPIFPHQHHHRNLRDITDIINKSKIKPEAKQTAIVIFNKLAEAEGTVHGKPKDDIHFHEVGAVDSIVDIVAASVGFHYFLDSGVEKFYCSTISVGGGLTKAEHGLIPIPGPATAELIRNVPVTAGPAQVELLTPTAAAILTTIAADFCPLPLMKILKTGYGAGTFNPEDFPNVLRLFIGESVNSEPSTVDSVCLLETNIDDLSGEIVGSVVEKIFEIGVLDCFTMPIYMKHNRPAYKLTVICEIKDEERISHFLFEQGLTLGIRRQILHRRKLERDFVTATTPFGVIKIKTGRLDGKVVFCKPEFSDCQQAAQRHNVAVKTVMDAAMAAYKRGKK
jgi:pyridinium-3,5-bisthiocarboxylic acid mononucleotide nickel chelatase